MGFGVRIHRNAAGRVSRQYFVRYRFHCKRRRYLLGTTPPMSLREARAEGRRVREVAGRGVDPREDPGLPTGVTRQQLKSFLALRHDEERFVDLAKSIIQQEETSSPVFGRELRQVVDDDRLSLGDLLERYLVAQGRKKSWAQDGQVIRRYFGHWLERSVEHISPADLRWRLREITERTPTSSNRALTCLKILCHWGIAEELIRRTPTQGVRPLIRERPRERTLQDAEIRNFWRSLEAYDPTGRSPWPIVLKALLLTGQRIGEVCRISWNEIEGDWWTISGSRTKNRRLHRVYLSELLRQVLEPFWRIHPEWMFPGLGQNRPLSPASAGNYLRGFRAAYPAFQDVRAHDLRRTFVTGAVRLGLPESHVARAVNHVKPGVTEKVYIQYTYDREIREVALAWAKHIRKLIEA